VRIAFFIPTAWSLKIVSLKSRKPLSLRQDRGKALTPEKTAFSVGFVGFKNPAFL